MRQHWKGLGMAQPGVGAAALTGRLCGHAERVHGVCGSSVLKGLFSIGRKQRGYLNCGKTSGVGGAVPGAGTRGEVRMGAEDLGRHYRGQHREHGKFPMALP